MEQKFYGKMSDGEEVSLFTLKNKNGMSVTVSDLGATVHNIIVPDKNGNSTDVITGYATLPEYEKNPSFFGAAIGRNGNRIKDASFTLNGKTYTLSKNDHGNNLHSGPEIFASRKWNYETENDESSESVTFFIQSPDGDQGFPGNLDVEVTYTLTDENELMIQYYGLSDEDTVFNMTNHSYFNLNGHASGTVLNHKLMLLCDGYTPADRELIPTGEIRDVTGTPFDFREEKTIGKDIHADDPDIASGSGYDCNLVIRGNRKTEDAEFFGRLTGDLSGITMEMYTDLPAVQFYTASTTNYPNGKDGANYQQYCSACFETQFCPNAVNTPEFVSPVIRRGEEAVSLTVYRFGLEA